VRVVGDSHAIVWYVQGSKRLSERAGEVLAEAEAERSLVVSVATLIDLWYVSQTTRSVTAEQLGALRERLGASDAVSLEPVTGP
jgi:PIN domain nuclease of toxin-antitoxin system